MVSSKSLTACLTVSVSLHCTTECYWPGWEVEEGGLPTESQIDDRFSMYSSENLYKFSNRDVATSTAPDWQTDVTNTFQATHGPSHTTTNSTLKYTFSHYQQHPNVCLQPWLLSWLCVLWVGIVPFAFLLFDHIVTVAVIDSAMLLANIAGQHSILWTYHNILMYRVSSLYAGGYEKVCYCGLLYVVLLLLLLLNGSSISVVGMCWTI